jgi:serine/threonine protein kinase
MSFDIGETVGHYRITERLGQGGMATVYRARDVRLERDVAVKVLHPAFKNDPSFNERFTREARIVANLNNDNIIPVYDTGEQDGQAYLVMRFIEGETLKARLSHGPLTVAETTRLLDAVAGALDYAHSAGILHRDIKPSNIMLERTTGKAFLADFGLARMADAGESTMSQDVMLGTPHYISPEQAQGLRDLSAGTDIYSLGVVLYEIVVGRVPFVADTPYAIVHDHIFAPLPLPSQVNPNVPKPIENVLLRALAKDRNDRYATTLDLADAFRQAATEAGIDVMPSGAYRVPFPLDGRVTAGTTALDTPRPSSGSVRPTISLPTASTPTPTAALTAGSTITVNDPVRSISELRRIQQDRRQRRNLWLFVGLAGLILTCLAGTIVTVSAFADPLVRRWLVLSDGSAQTPFVIFDTTTVPPTGTPDASTGSITPPATTAATPDSIIRRLNDPNTSVLERDRIIEELYKRATDKDSPVLIFRTFAQQHPEIGEAQALAAVALQNAGQPRAAENNIKEALRLAPDSQYILLMAGWVAQARDEKDRARGYLEKARDAADASPWVVDEANRLLKELGG